MFDDPEAAMLKAGFPEINWLQEMQASAVAEEEAEGAGHIVAYSAVRLAWTDCIVLPNQ